METVQDVTTLEVAVVTPVVVAKEEQEVVPSPVLVAKEEQDVVDANSSTGRWTQEEHEIFLEGLKIHDKHWKLIADMVKTRTVVQIRTHAQKYFQKLEKSKAGGANNSSTSTSTKATQSVDAKVGCDNRDSTCSSSTGDAGADVVLVTGTTASEGVGVGASTSSSVPSSATTTSTAKKSRSRSSSEGAPRKRSKKASKSAVSTPFSDELDILLENIDWHTTAAVDMPNSGSVASSSSSSTGGHVFMPGQSKYHDPKAHANFSKMIKEYKLKVQAMNISNGNEEEDPLGNFHLLPRYIKSTVVPPSLTLIDNTFCHYPLSDEPGDGTSFVTLSEVSTNRMRSCSAPSLSTVDLDNYYRGNNSDNGSSNSNGISDNASTQQQQQQQQPCTAWFPLSRDGAEDDRAVTFHQQHRHTLHSVSFDDVQNPFASVSHHHHHHHHHHLANNNSHFPQLTVMTLDLPGMTPPPLLDGSAGTNAAITGAPAFRMSGGETTPPTVIMHSVTPPSSVSPKNTDISTHSNKKRGRPMSKKAIAAANRAAKVTAAAAAAAVVNAASSNGSSAFTMPSIWNTGATSFGTSTGVSSDDNEDETAFNFDGALEELHVSEGYLESLIEQVQSPSGGLTTCASATCSAAHAQQQELNASSKISHVPQYFSNLVSPSEIVHKDHSQPLGEFSFFHRASVVAPTTYGSGTVAPVPFEGDELVDNMLELFE